MSDLINETLRVLAPWPVAQGFFIIVIAFMGFMAIRRGDRDRRAGVSQRNVEMPMYLMGGPVHDAIGAIHDIAEESRKISTMLKNIDEGQSYTHKLLEAILRNQELRPETAPPQRPTRK